MPYSELRVDNRPAAGQFVDLEVSAGTVSHTSWRDARNVMYLDDGTPTRRLGLSSEHIRFDFAGQIVQQESPDTYAVGGLHQFDRIRTSRSRGRTFLAKVDEFLVGSNFGDEFNIPLGRGLGDSSFYADFTTFYRTADSRNLCIVMSDFEDFAPAYWTGNSSKWNNEAGDYPKWGFLRPIEQLTDGRFSTEHNGRLFVAAQDGVRVYYSAPNDPLDFFNGGFVEVNHRFGDVTGFFETFYGEFFIGQERAIQRVTFDANGDIASLVPLTTEVGLVNNRCTAQVGSDIYFLGSKGQVHTLQTTQRFGDLLTGAHSQRVYKRFERLPRAAWRAAFMLDDPERQILWTGHSIGSGLQNDTLTGWDYRHDRWVYAENRAIGGFSCGAVLETSMYQRPRAYFGTYATAPNSVGGTGTSGRIFAFSAHKEDRASTGAPVELVDTTDPNHLAPIVDVPASGGMNVTSAELSATGTYFNSSAYQASIILRVTTAGTTGAGSGPVLQYNDRTANLTGTINTALGTTYAGAAFSLSNGVDDLGFDIQLPVGRALNAGEVIYIYTASGRSVTRVNTSDFPDLQENLVFNVKGSGASFNFVSYLESAGFFLEDPQNEFEIQGFTVITRCVGNRADDQTDGDDSHADQNQYRWMLDMYLRCDDDDNWNQIALLDGNAAKMPHLDQSLSEVAGDYVDRGDLVLRVSPDDTEAGGQPMCRRGTVNTEYVEVNRRCKVFWLRFGQETAASLDHTLSGGGQNRDESMRLGDFNLVSVHFHLKKQAASEMSMGEGSTTIKFEVPGVA